MEFCKETKWLCENAKTLEKFAGQWVMFCASEGLLGNGESFPTVFRSFHQKKSKSASVPFIFHVPLKEELVASLPVAAKK